MKDCCDEKAISHKIWIYVVDHVAFVASTIETIPPNFSVSEAKRSFTVSDKCDIPFDFSRAIFLVSKFTL